MGVRDFNGQFMPQDLDTPAEKNEKRSRGGSAYRWTEAWEKAWEEVPSKRPEGLGWKREQ